MPRHVVVDGSNLATEGRPHPSLAQLNEAVLAYMAEHPDMLVTVVVDATFGHRIDPREVPEFDEAVANNELVAPPAGAIGRGDAFVLAVANRVNAVVLSNDSFQEFHGTYPWLFDEGRLVGGKPVPHVGWVFVPRLPVRGPVSRSAVKESKRKRDAGGASTATVRVGSPEASQPMPVPKAPPPARAPRRASAPKAAPAAAPAAPVPAPAPAPVAVPAAATRPSTGAVNEPDAFLAFVAGHPLGTSVNAVVESYSSHGAYVRVGEVRCYVPLRLMADPPPRSAREFFALGDAVTLVVESYSAERRSVDLAVAAMATHQAPLEATPAKRVPRRTKAAAAAEATPAATPEAPVPSRRRRAPATPAADTAPVAEPAAPTEPAVASPRPAKRVSKKVAAAAAPADAAASPTAGEVVADGSVEAPAATPAPKGRARKAAAPPVEAPAVEAPAAEAPPAAAVRPRRSSRRSS